MSKNMIQHQHGYSLLELFKNYGTEQQCIEALFKWKWAGGYICSKCGSKSYCSLKYRNIYQCNHCHHLTSVTANTIFEQTKLPLTAWFLCVHLITQAKTGISALALKREGVVRRIKPPFIAAVSTNEEGHPIYMNFHVVEGFRLTEVSRWAKKHLSSDSLVSSDGLACLPR